MKLVLTEDFLNTHLCACTHTHTHTHTVYITRSRKRDKFPNSQWRETRSLPFSRALTQAGPADVPSDGVEEVAPDVRAENLG